MREKEPKYKEDDQWINAVDLFHAPINSFLYMYGFCPKCKEQSIPIWTDAETMKIHHTKHQKKYFDTSRIL